MFRKWRMSWKITLFSFGIVLFAICIGGTILVGRLLHIQEKGLEQKLLVTARTVAEVPFVIHDLSVSERKKEMNDSVERIRIINGMDYIVVMDMAGIRWSHPVASLIGTPSQGTDLSPAFAEHTYVSKAKGELGTALRAFVPVMNDRHEQVGVVLAGQLLPSLSGMLAEMKGQIYLALTLTLLFGIWGSWLLSRHIKQQMFQLEPQEIAQLLVERTAIFHAMHEGVIAIDNRDRITVFNEKAKKMLHIEGDVVGRPIREVLPDTRLPENLENNHAVYNQEFFIGQTLIFSNRIPITIDGELVGAVAIFQDRTEVAKMAEELTGVKEFVEALRVQKHEYMNKLHTIGGLIQLDHREKALDYLFQITESEAAFDSSLAGIVDNENVKGLLLGKISRGRELGIDVHVDRQSRLSRLPRRLDGHDVVVLIGNLIENAFDSLSGKPGIKEIIVSIEQDEHIFSLLVEDNGIGMQPAASEQMFERGFSTKGGEDRGIGLYLVKNIVDKSGGSIQVQSVLGEGTSIMLAFPMDNEGEEEDGQAADFGYFD